MSGFPSLPSRKLNRGVRVLLWVVGLIVIYPISVAAVVSTYWLKTNYDYNILTAGGWHAFGACLVKQIPVEKPKAE